MTTVAVITGDAATGSVADQQPPDTKIVTESPITSEMAASDRTSWLASLPVDVIVFGPDIEADVVLDSASFLRTARPEVDCIAVCTPRTDFLASAMKAGIRDVVSPSEGNQELLESLTLLEEAAAIRASSQVEPRTELGSVVTILGPKGGVGKTTVAVNLAYTLAMQASGSVILLDLDLSGGDVADSLGLEPSSNIGTVVGSGVVDDPTSLKLSLTSHSSGLLILAAPNSLVDAAKAEAAGVSGLIDQLTRMFKTVVIDTGPGTSDATVSAVKAAADIIAVTSPEIGGVRTLERHLDGYDAVGFQRAKRHLLLNKEDRRNSMAREDVESVLRRRIDYVLPYDRNIPAPANEGVPYLQSRPRGAVTNTFATMATVLKGAALPAAASGSDTKGWFR